MIIYFAIDRAHLTQEMINRSLPANCGNPFKRRRSSDDTKILLKFNCSDIPAELCALYYEPMTEDAAAIYLANSDNGFLVTTDLATTEAV